MDCSWEEQLEQRFKYDRNLNFSTMPGVDDEFGCQKKKVSRDPMSHRIIEKRRRDRMNNCLADLSSLIPSNFLKKQGRGRIEKTEIIEMAIKHLKQLQAHHCKATNGCPGLGNDRAADPQVLDEEQYCLGYQECLSETMHFLVEIQACYPGDPLCVQIMNHLSKHRERVLKGRQSNSPAKESENLNNVCKHGTGSPDGSLLDRTSPASFRPISRNGQMEQEECRLVIPKTEENSLYGGSTTMRSGSETTDVHMSDAGMAEAGGGCFAPLAANGQFCGAPPSEGVGGSQLREMLQNPSLQVQRARSLSASSSRPISTASSASSSTRAGDLEVYKFKRNIKERFRADQMGMRGPPGAEGGERRFSEPVVEIPASAFHPFQARSSSSSKTLESLLTSSSAAEHCSSQESVSISAGADFGPELDKPKVPFSQRHEFGAGANDEQNLGPPQAEEVPIFVLHPKGNFYVPMTVAGSLVLPYLNLVPNVVPQLLHHVGLAVYFCSGASAKVAGGHLMAPVLNGQCIADLRHDEVRPALQQWPAGIVGRT